MCNEHQEIEKQDRQRAEEEHSHGTHGKWETWCWFLWYSDLWTRRANEPCWTQDVSAQAAIHRKAFCAVASQKHLGLIQNRRGCWNLEGIINNKSDSKQQAGKPIFLLHRWLEPVEETQPPTNDRNSATALQAAFFQTKWQLIWQRSPRLHLW